MAVIDRLQLWAQRAGDLPLRHLPRDELIVINERQHPAVLIPKAIRTGAGFGMMVSRPTIGLVVIFALAVLADVIRGPAHFKRLTILLMVIALALALFLVGAHASSPWRAVTGLGLLGWLFADVLTWCFDRLIVTSQRLYRVHGLMTTRRLSVPLLSITVVELELGPAGRWFGTLRFDTPAQRDSAIERFTYVRDAGHVHVTILQLRGEASTG